MIKCVIDINITNDDIINDITDDNIDNIKDY